MEQEPTSIADLDFAATADKLYQEYSRKKFKEAYLARRLGGQTRHWLSKDEWASIEQTRLQGLNAIRALQVTEEVPPLVVHVPRKRKAAVEAKDSEGYTAKHIIAIAKSDGYKQWCKEKGYSDKIDMSKLPL